MTRRSTTHGTQVRSLEKLFGYSFLTPGQEAANGTSFYVTLFFVATARLMTSTKIRNGPLHSFLRYCCHDPCRPSCRRW